MGNAGAVHLPVRLRKLHPRGCGRALFTALYIGAALPEQTYPRGNDRTAQRHNSALEETAGSVIAKLGGLEDLRVFLFS